MDEKTVGKFVVLGMCMFVFNEILSFMKLAYSINDKFFGQELLTPLVFVSLGGLFACVAFYSNRFFEMLTQSKAKDSRVKVVSDVFNYIPSVLFLAFGTWHFYEALQITFNR